MAKTSPPTRSKTASTCSSSPISVVCHRLDRAERARQLELLRAPDRRDRPAVQCADDLDGGRADRARGSGDQHARAERDAHELRQRNPRREEGHREGSPLGEARRGRQREEPARVDRDALCVAAPFAANEAHDALAVELACDLGAEHRRELRHLRVHPAADEDVREVDPRRAHLDDGLTVGGLGLGHLLDDELLGLADRLAGRRLSTAGELRLALLEERGDALRAVFGLEAAAEAVGLAAQTLLEREVARRARELAEHRDRDG